MLELTICMCSFFYVVAGCVYFCLRASLLTLLQEAPEGGEKGAGNATKDTYQRAHIDLSQRMATKDETARAHQSADEDGDDNGPYRTHAKNSTMCHQKSYNSTCTGRMCADLPEAVDERTAYLDEDRDDNNI